MSLYTRACTVQAVRFAKCFTIINTEWPYRIKNLCLPNATDIGPIDATVFITAFISPGLI